MRVRQKERHMRVWPKQRQTETHEGLAKTETHEGQAKRETKRETHEGLAKRETNRETHEGQVKTETDVMCTRTAVLIGIDSGKPGSTLTHPCSVIPALSVAWTLQVSVTRHADVFG